MINCVKSCAEVKWHQQSGSTKLCQRYKIGHYDAAKCKPGASLAHRVGHGMSASWVRCASVTILFLFFSFEVFPLKYATYSAKTFLKTYFTLLRTQKIHTSGYITQHLPLPLGLVIGLGSLFNVTLGHWLNFTLPAVGVTFPAGRRITACTASMAGSCQIQNVKSELPGFKVM